MPGLFSIASADLASRRTVTALTVAAIALGTAVAVAAFTSSAAVQDSLERAALARVGNAAIAVEALDRPGFATESLDGVRAIPGVTGVAPEVRTRTFFRTGAVRGFVEVLGVDPAADAAMHPARVAAGRALAPGDGLAAVAGRSWAQANGIRTGDAVELITREGFQRFEVVGLIEDADLSQRGSAGIVRVPISTAQAAFGSEGRVQALDISVDDPARAKAVQARLEAVLPYVFTARLTSEIVDDQRASIADFRVALAFFGAIALLAGAVLVFNTLSLTLNERMREIGLLRAVGAPTGYVLRLTLAQGLLAGVAGALIGVLLGQALAVVLLLAVSATQGVSVAGVPFSPAGIAAGLALGVGATLLASVVPAIRAARMPALAALNATRAAPGMARGLGGVLSAPIPVLAAVAAWPIHRLSRGIATLAERTVRRERGQTALTVASFVIGLGLIVALANSADSFSNAGQSWAQSLFPGDLVVVSPVDQPVELIEPFTTIDGVEQVSPVSFAPVVWQGVRLTAAGVDPAHYFQAFDVIEGLRTDAFRQMRRGSGVLITAALAREMELKVGDEMPLEVNGLPLEMTVAGIVAHSMPTSDGFGAVVVPQDALAGSGTSSFRFLALSLAPDADGAAVTVRVRETAEQLGMQAGTRGDLAASVGGAVGALFALLGGLVAAAVVVGALGLATTLMMNIAQRTRELGILRSLGMRRASVGRLALAEAAIMGALGAVLAVLLGTILTWVLVSATRTADLDAQPAFSLSLALGVIVAGTVVAALAALYPASLAARGEVVEALRDA